jgi:hypothetical protein
LKVAIALDAGAGSALKLRFRKLCFDQEFADAEIYLGALNMICD